jgi:hypothetical protein
VAIEENEAAEEQSVAEIMNDLDDDDDDVNDDDVNDDDDVDADANFESEEPKLLDELSETEPGTSVINLFGKLRYQVLNSI